MRTPITLIIPAAVLGVIVPLVFVSFAIQFDLSVVAALLCLGSWGVIPIVATAIAYRHGYDRGLAKGRESEEGRDCS